MGIAEQSVLRIDAVDLYHIDVSAGAQEVFAVRSDAEVARVRAR